MALSEADLPPAKEQHDCFDGTTFGVATGDGLRHGTALHVVTRSNYVWDGWRKKYLAVAHWFCGGTSYHAEFGSLGELEELGYRRCRCCFGAFHAE